MSIGWTLSLASMRGLWREDAGDVHAGAALGAAGRGHRRLGRTGAAGAGGAAIVMVVAVSAGLAWVNPTAAKYCWVLIPIVH